MIQQSYSFPFSTPYDGEAYFDSSRVRKRKLAFSASVDYKETKTITKKRKKEMRPVEENIADMDRDFSIDLDFPDDSLPSSNNDDIFDWMENMLVKGNGETSDVFSTVSPAENKIKIFNTGDNCDDIDIDSFLTMNESDPCYEDMISLLAQDENNVENEENVFKKIQESFISDRLLEHDSVSSTLPKPVVDFSKGPILKRSTSFNTRRARSSRIGIREGLQQLVKANRLTARTRYMLLNCKPSLYKN